MLAADGIITSDEYADTHDAAVLAYRTVLSTGKINQEMLLIYLVQNNEKYRAISIRRLRSLL